MRAGLLRHKVSIEYKSVTRNGFGEEVLTWPELAGVWARVETLTGGESVEQSKAGAALTHTVLLRYRSDVLPTMRIAWHARVLEIHAVVPDALKGEMALECSEVI